MQTHDTGNRAKKPKVSYRTSSSSGKTNSLWDHVPTALRTALRISPFEQEYSEFQNFKQEFADKNNILLQKLNEIIQNPRLQDDFTLQEHTKKLINNYNRYNNILNKFQNKIDAVKTNPAAQESELNTIKTINERLKLMKKECIDDLKPRLYKILKESVEFHQDLDRVKKRIKAGITPCNAGITPCNAGITPCNADYMTALQDFLNNASPSQQF